MKLPLPSTRRVVLGAAVTALVLGLSACGASASPTAARTSSPSSRSTVDPAVAALVASAHLPAASLLTATSGLGSEYLALPSTSIDGKHLTIKVSCDGSGRASITDSNNAAVLSFGCYPGSRVIYTTGFSGTSADKRIHIVLKQGTPWAIAAWNA